MRLPEINQHVAVIVVAEQRQLTTRVEDVEGEDMLLIAPPSEDGVPQDLATGEEIAIEWTSERGLMRGTGTVLGRRRGVVPLVEVRMLDGKVIQRREYVRTESVIDVDLSRPGQEPVRCSTLDLSGSGMRAVVPFELQADELVEVLLRMPDGIAIKARATVVRGGEEDVYAFHFLEIDPRFQERLIRFVFAQHRREFTTVRRGA